MQHQYELLSYVVRLSFRDAFGLEAQFDSYQLLRVVGPQLDTVTQHFWGKGDQLRSVVTIPTKSSRVVQRSGRNVLESTLNVPARRNDEVEVYTRRIIHHGFKAAREGWEFMPFTPTDNVRLAITFPLAKEPQHLALNTSSGARTASVRRPGTKEVVVSIKSPIVGSLYRLDWNW